MLVRKILDIGLLKIGLRPIRDYYLVTSLFSKARYTCPREDDIDLLIFRLRSPPLAAGIDHVIK